MSTPELKLEWISDRLSLWHKWSDRNQINGAELPGVYLLAHLEFPPSTVDPRDERVIYVGETHSSNQGLKWRWQEFQRSAFGPEQSNHAGGNTYRETFGPAHVAELYVSGLAIALEEPWYFAFILAAERLLIWEYALRHHRLPNCNTK